ncbi:MAG: hypothetical protein KatS3mg115_0003 [Candidatus Poribacteria bacterium]|nr:MAG: hypothetical protein KatS3mg115_0003 [Candidatus Poribacteria bacterium]
MGLLSFGKAERVIRLGMLGHVELYASERAGGAWIAVGLLALWGTRRHLCEAFRRALSHEVREERTDPLSYQTALFGFLGGLLLFSFLSFKAGMTAGAIGGFICLYLVMSIGVARVRAEFGPPSHEILALDPGRLMTLLWALADWARLI